MTNEEIIESQCKYCHYYRALYKQCTYDTERDNLVGACMVFEEEVKRMKPYFDKVEK